MQEAEEPEAVEGPVGKSGVCNNQRHYVTFGLMYVLGTEFDVHGYGQVGSNA